ncbi:hypothetical protein B0I35DRAFT_350891 [Stachybotrys elegans]|uniref:Uncharacterized protein n=1 Tax=Stachybotrys elegans TaxID=80388 RepID=A0A8K0WT89_9HYPO|nr:hypothetical protein B0I35DRAFT_350891 [Stachybotrys elegans]
MKFSLVAAAALLGLASAQQAVVVNHCKDTVYVQSWPYGGAQPGPLTTVAPGKSFTENLRGTGSTVKIAKTKTLDKPLFFGYSFSSNPAYTYYELSSEWGNPFADKRNTLSPGSGCQSFDCSANNANCYSTPAHKKVFGCPSPVKLTTELCK